MTQVETQTGVFADRVAECVDRKRSQLVLGLDPLWVVRHEDFEMLARWEHCPEEKDAAGKAVAAKK